MSAKPDYVVSKLTRPTGGAATGGFVINLTSSTTPMALSQPKDPTLAQFTFFVSRRLEDGRERFRLHMGYFETVQAAEEMLVVVRDVYPGAWASEAPGKKLRGNKPQAAATPPPPAKPIASTPAPAAPVRAAAPPAPAPAPQPVAPPVAAAPVPHPFDATPPPPELKYETEPEPFVLTDEPEFKPANIPVVQPPEKPVASAPPTVAAAKPAAKLAAARAAAKPQAKPAAAPAKPVAPKAAAPEAAAPAPWPLRPPRRRCRRLQQSLRLPPNPRLPPAATPAQPALPSRSLRSERSGQAARGCAEDCRQGHGSFASGVGSRSESAALRNRPCRCRPSNSPCPRRRHSPTCARSSRSSTTCPIRRPFACSSAIRRIAKARRKRRSTKRFASSSPKTRCRCRPSRTK